MVHMKEGKVLLDYSNQRNGPQGLDGVELNEFPLDYKMIIDKVNMSGVLITL